METNIRYTAVGAFVIFLATCITLSIIWLSAGFSTKSYIFYKVYMQESVSGLSVDAPVEYNGVNVGTVREININKTNPHLVDLILRIEEDTPITMGTRARLELHTLSGVGYLQLIDKGNNRRPLKAQPNQEYPVIGTTPSLYLRLDSMLNQLNDSLIKASKSFQSLLNQRNLTNIQNILQSSQGTMRALEIETLPATTQAIYNANQAFDNLSNLSDELKKNPAIIIRGKEQPPLGPGEQ